MYQSWNYWKPKIIFVSKFVGLSYGKTSPNKTLPRSRRDNHFYQLQLQSSFLLLQIIIIQFVFKRLRSQTLSCFLKCFSKSISQNLGSVSTNSWIKTKSFGHLQFNQLLMVQSCFFKQA